MPSAADHSPRFESRVWSIGHSTHTLDAFLGLLDEHRIETLVDIRSVPRSEHVPHANSNVLKRRLEQLGKQYVFEGHRLGGRPDGDEFYDAEDHVLYSRLATSPAFEQGLDQVAFAATRTRLALLCSEEDPAVCHRALLVGRVLLERHVIVGHIRGNGDITDQLAMDNSHQAGLFGESEDHWRSIRSVSRRGRPRTSSGH